VSAGFTTARVHAVKAAATAYSVCGDTAVAVLRSGASTEQAGLHNAICDGSCRSVKIALRSRHCCAHVAPGLGADVRCSSVGDNGAAWSRSDAERPGTRA
jgi:hypothetical protein